LYTPLTVAVTVTAGALVSAWIDYRLLTPVLRGDAARRLSTRLSPRFSSFRRLRRVIGAGARQSFISHVLVHLLPVPSAPSKFLAIASGYPLRRYQAALVVGRAPRYYLLAWLGAVIAPPPWALALLLPTLVGTRLLRAGARAPDSTEP
jgi:uncharacterized membrane protein YdjX (TVP38/TMEM64 family)